MTAARGVPTIALPAGVAGLPSAAAACAATSFVASNSPLASGMIADAIPTVDSRPRCRPSAPSNTVRLATLLYCCAAAATIAGSCYRERREHEQWDGDTAYDARRA